MATPTNSPPLPSSDKSHISSLSIHALRVELSRRNLSTAGLRNALEARLAYDIAARQTRPRRRRTQISVPNVFSSSVAQSSPVEKSTTEAPPTENPAINSPSSDKSPIKSPPTSPPVTDGSSTKPHPLPKGVLRGRSVWVTGADMHTLWKEMGPMGKGNLSRAAPTFHDLSLLPAARKGRAIRQLLAMGQEEGTTCEHLQLTLVEAFYTAFIAHRLTILHNDTPLTMDQAWQMFSHDAKFGATLVAFCRYRSCGWLPRSGIKYGVDWVLYPIGTKRHTHAPYCILFNWDSALEPSWIRLQTRLRLVKNVAKRLVIVKMEQWQKQEALAKTFARVKMRELSVDRWLP